jgi:hypothetical protein
MSAACIRDSISAEHENVQTSVENSVKKRNSSIRTVLICAFIGEDPELTPFLALILGAKVC